MMLQSLKKLVLINDAILQRPNPRSTWKPLTINFEKNQTLVQFKT
jgi:hypothetical protein